MKCFTDLQIEYSRAVKIYIDTNIFEQEELTAENLQDTLDHKNNVCKDADNFEEKPLSDMIAKLFIIGGDGHENVQRMSLTQKDDYDFTEIFLVPRTNFIEFWSEFYPQNTW